MNKIKDFLFSSLGSVGIILFYILGVLLVGYPLMMFDMQFWLFLVLLIAIELFLINLPFATEILWIVGFFGALNGPQDIFTIIYYVVFAIIIISFVINLIRAFKN